MREQVESPPLAATFCRKCRNCCAPRGWRPPAKAQFQFGGNGTVCCSGGPKLRTASAGNVRKTKTAAPDGVGAGADRGYRMAKLYHYRFMDGIGLQTSLGLKSLHFQ
jgi:hypothetical protein